MASTIAMFTALSGMNANARQLDVIGNNIANANTTAFKSNRMLFSTQFNRTLSVGTPPGDTSGGTNPGQIGLGVAVAGTQRNFSGGAISATGDYRDLAIEGGGFFIVERDGRQMYTRAGNFRPNNRNELVTIGGERVMGYGVDERFNLVTGRLTPLTIPVGAMTLAEATQNVRMAGNLNANGPLPTHGARVELRGTSTAGLRTITGATPAPTPPNIIEAASRLVDIEDPNLPSSNTPVFTAGQRLEIRGAERGGKDVPPATLDITASTTVQDLMDFLRDAIGLRTGIGNNPDGATPGLALDPVTGVIAITGNTGTVNDLRIDATDLRVLDSAGTVVRSSVFATNKAASADGESVRTTFIVYDSLGTPVSVDLSMVADSRGTNGTTWRYYADSGDDSDLAIELGTGLISFDTQGRLSTQQPIAVSLDRDGSGAASPMAFSISLQGQQDVVTALASARSEIAATYADGSPIGTLASFAVGENGVISGSFTNGLTRTIGQVPIATFANDAGLVDIGANLFETGPNSGSPQIKQPGSLGSGKIVGGALELSNVDLGNEFIQMILASTGYSASSRVIRTTDELMQQLLVLGR